jgi:hypothetical protein
MPDNTQVYFPCYTWINHSKLYFGQPRVLFTNDVRISLPLSHMHIYKHNYATSVTKMSHNQPLLLYLIGLQFSHIPTLTVEQHLAITQNNNAISLETTTLIHGI